MAIESKITVADEWHEGEDKTIRIDVVQDDDVTPQVMTGWALEWRLETDRQGVVLLTKTTAAGITIENGAGTDDRATITVDRADDVTAAASWHELWRTDAGTVLLLSFGSVLVQKTAKPEP